MSEPTSSYLDPEVRAAIAETVTVEIPQHKTPEGAWCPISGCTSRSGVCPCGFDPTSTASPATKPLAGLDELLPPGAAQQVRAEHDAAVGTLQALLAEARQDADRIAEQHVHAMDRADALAAELGVAQGLPVADVVAAARAIVEAGRGTPGSTERRKRLERALATVVEPLAVVVAAARWTDRYGRVGAVEALTALEDAVRALPAEEVRRG